MQLDCIGNSFSYQTGFTGYLNSYFLAFRLPAIASSSEAGGDESQDKNDPDDPVHPV
jgi:hypothetical protein